MSWSEHNLPVKCQLQ